MYYKYKVATNELETSSVRLLTLERLEPDSKPLLYQPGQYAAISLNDLSRPTPARCFSLASSPSQQRELEFSIRVGGVFTSALERLKRGDEVIVRGPFGGFIFNEYLHKDLVMFAGGIGIAPFMSMIRYATDHNLENKLHLVYSSRNEKDIAFLNELKFLESKNPNFKITHVISEGATDTLNTQNVILGRITNKNIGELGLSFKSQTYMICGPKAYMNAIYDLLETSGTPKSNILTEAFSQGSKMQTQKHTSWPFNMYALTGVSLLISGIFVIASDLYKTLPKLNNSAPITQTSTDKNYPGGNLLDKINALGPQVDTNITQSPVIKYKQTATRPAVAKPTPVPVVSKPNPVVVAPAPAPTTKPTVIPKTKPRTRVS